MPTVPKLDWAKNEFYPADGSGNPWRSGSSPTKVEPPGGIVLTGVVPDSPVAAQWENYWKNRVAQLAKKSLLDIAGRFVKLGSFTTAGDNDIGATPIATSNNLPVKLGPPAWICAAKRFVAGDLTNYQWLDPQLNATNVVSAGTSCPGYDRVFSTFDPWEHNQDFRVAPVVHVMSMANATAGFFTVNGYTADTQLLQAGVSGLGGTLGDAQVCEYNTASQKGFLVGALTNGGADACIVPRNGDIATATTWGLFGSSFGPPGKLARSWFWVPNAAGTARLHYYMSQDASRVSYASYTGGLSTQNLIDTAFLPVFANEFICHPWVDTIDQRVRYAKSIITSSMARGAYHTYIYENDFTAYRNPTDGLWTTPTLAAEVNGVSLVSTFRYSENVIYATGLSWAGSNSLSQCNLYVTVDGGLTWHDTGATIAAGSSALSLRTIACQVTWSRSPCGVVCTVQRAGWPVQYWVNAGGVLDFNSSDALTP